MSRSPFVITLIVSGTLVTWFYLTPGADARTKSDRPAGRSTVRQFGYPDVRGIILELRESPFVACAATRFRNESPALAAWDDGTVVFRTSTFDYRQTTVPFEKVKQWARTFRAYSAEDLRVECGSAAPSPATGRVTLRGVGWGLASTLTVASLSPAHADRCEDCLPLRPLAKMLQEMDGLVKQGSGEPVTGLPVEVYLEWRSCGCRNHPEIVDVSKEWPVSGRRPYELCGNGSRRIRLDDPAEIRKLSEAITRSAAVLDRGDIYTCFMRPLMEPPKEGTLARR